MSETKETVFENLYNIDCKDKIEKKGNLSYLSWTWAWAELLKRYPNSTFTIYETTNPQGYICNYFTDGKTCWVKVGVTVNGVEHIEELPVMDYKNKSIPFANVTSMDICKSIQRCKTKAIAYHGLGLYIYAGEDLPEEVADTKPTPKTKPVYKVSTNDYTPSDNFLALETLVNSYNAEIRKDVLQLCLKALESKNENEIADKLDRLRKYLNTKGIEV